MEDTNKHDISKLKRTVRFFEALLRASADGIVITDPAKNIIFANDIFCEYFSRKNQDMIETNIFVWLEKHESQRPEYLEWNGKPDQRTRHSHGC